MRCLAQGYGEVAAVAVKKVIVRSLKPEVWVACGSSMEAGSLRSGAPGPFCM